MSAPHSVQAEPQVQELGRAPPEHHDNDDTESIATTAAESCVRSIRIERPAMSLESLTSHGNGQEKSSLTEKLRKRCKCAPLQMLYSLMPIVYWLPRYDFKSDLTLDLVAGFTIAVLQIPQGMAYALLGNLPPIIGLYMAFFPVLVYAVMGTSRHVSIGTFAVICLMTGKVALERLESYHGDASSDYSIVQISAALSLCVGLWQILFGILHTGALSLLLSSDLVSGFTTGAAFHVLTSQVRTVLGLRMPRRSGIFKIILTYYDVGTHVHKTNLAAVVMSATTFTVLCCYNELVRPLVDKTIKFPLPMELICIVAGTLASRAWSFHDLYSVSIVGTIPTGLPLPNLPPVEILPALIADGLLIGVVSFAISISMIKIFSTKLGYEIDPNQELLAQGTSNVVGSLFTCAPISVSLSRSAIQVSMGGRTQLVGIFSAALILVVLLWIGPFFATLPNCILSAIIIVALKGMFLQVYDLPKAWRKSRLNGLIWVATAMCTIVLDVEYGLAMGLALSIVVLLWRSNVPTITVLGSLGDMDIFTDISNAEAKEVRGIKIVKYTGSLNFTTIAHFTRKLGQIVPIQCAGGQSGQTRSASEVRFIILDLSSASSIDPAAVGGLEQLYKQYQAASIQMLLVGPPTPVLNTFANCQVFKEIGIGKFFPTIHDAISFANAIT